MTKAKLIIGPPASGKSMKVMQLIEDYKNPLFFKGSESCMFQYGLHPETDVIVIEECGRDFNYQDFYKMIKEGLPLPRKGEQPTKINPDFIFVSQYKPLGINASFLYRFELIELDIVLDDRELEDSEFDEFDDLLYAIFDTEYFIKKSANQIEIGYIQNNMYSLSMTAIIQEMNFYGWVRISSYPSRNSIFYIFERQEN